MSNSIIHLSRATRASLLVLSLLSLPLAQSPSIAKAASPNAINNQTTAVPAPWHGEPDASRSLGGGIGPYDDFDQFRDRNGFPLGGEAQLFFP